MAGLTSSDFEIFGTISAKELDERMKATCHGLGLKAAARQFIDEQGCNGEFVYMLVCQDVDGPAYIKFGVASNLRDRADAIQTGCPIPYQVLGFVEVWTRERALDIEAALHDEFKDKRVSGEWFRFNLSKDKAAFNSGWKKVFSEYLPDDIEKKWHKVNINKSLDRRGPAIDAVVLKVRKEIDKNV